MSLMVHSLVLAAALFETQQGGVCLKVESERAAIDPGRSTFVRVELRSPEGKKATLPDLRERLRGFSLAEDFEEEPVKGKDGGLTQVANWRLDPEPCAETYKIRCFVVPVTGANGADESFVAGPVRFEAPGPREPVKGEMEVEAEKDLPPFSWKLVGVMALWTLAALAAGYLLFLVVRYLARRVREHRMSPIERAWVELDRLLKKGLPGRGRYKDFYVELTMVVRRYVQRKYGIKAPHLTTEEFMSELASGATVKLPNANDLRAFLESADMVKFAGLEASVEMTETATESARVYLKGDDGTEVRQ